MERQQMTNFGEMRLPMEHLGRDLSCTEWKTQRFLPNLIHVDVDSYLGVA